MVGENEFLRRIARLAEDDPEALAFCVYSGQDCTTLSRSSLVEKASVHAGYLQREGVSAGDVVFLVARHTIELYTCFLGAMLIGAIPSFLPFPSPKQEPARYWRHHRSVFERTRAKAVVTTPEFRVDLENSLLGLRTAVLEMGAGAGQPGGGLDTRRWPSNADIALLQHSSGTTGLKKGVMLSFDALAKHADSYVERLRMSAQQGDTIVSWLPLYHDMGLIACFVTPVQIGVPVVSIDPFEWLGRPSRLLDLIEKHGGTHCWMPNFAFTHLVRTLDPSRRYDLTSVKALINCSEPCRPETVDRFLEAFAASGLSSEALTTCYAMAETVFAVSQPRLGQAPRRLSVDLGGCVNLRDEGRPITLLSNGPPVEGIEAAVLDSDSFVANGSLGEICLRGDFLFDGYFADEQSTQAAFFQGYFRTGDLGFIREGEIYVAGRLKELLILNGKNVYSHDIEAALGDVEGVRPGRAVAFGVFNAEVDSEQLVVVAERAGPDSDDRATRRAINRAVTSAIGLVAGDVRLVAPGWLIKTTSGKISRSENKQKYLSEVLQ